MISLIITLFGIIFAIYKNKGIPNSISAIAYIIPHWLFSTWICLSGIALAPELFNYLPENLEFLGFLFVLGIMIVSSTSYYRQEGTTLHYIGAILSTITAFLIIKIPLQLIWIPYLIYILRTKNTRYFTFISECIIYILLIITIYDS